MQQATYRKRMADGGSPRTMQERGSRKKLFGIIEVMMPASYFIVIATSVYIFIFIFYALLNYCNVL